MGVSKRADNVWKGVFQTPPKIGKNSVRTAHPSPIWTFLTSSLIKAEHLQTKIYIRFCLDTDCTHPQLGKIQPQLVAKLSLCASVAGLSWLCQSLWNRHHHRHRNFTCIRIKLLSYFQLSFQSQLSSVFDSLKISILTMCLLTPYPTLPGTVPRCISRLPMAILKILEVVRQH